MQKGGLLLSVRLDAIVAVELRLVWISFPVIGIIRTIDTLQFCLAKKLDRDLWRGVPQGGYR